MQLAAQAVIDRGASSHFGVGGRQLSGLQWHGPLCPLIDLEQATGPSNLISPALDGPACPRAAQWAPADYTSSTQTLHFSLSILGFKRTAILGSERYTYIGSQPDSNAHPSPCIRRGHQASRRDTARGTSSEPNSWAADHTVLPWPCTIKSPSHGRPVRAFGPHDDPQAWTERPQMGGT